MSILVVTDKYPPSPVGGAEISLHLLLKRLCRNGLEIQVAVLDGHANADASVPEMYEGVPVFGLPALPTWPPTQLETWRAKTTSPNRLSRRLAWPESAIRYLAKTSVHTFSQRLDRLMLYRSLSKARATSWVPMMDDDLVNLGPATLALKKLIDSQKPKLIHADNYRSILVSAAVAQDHIPFVAMVRDNRFFCTRRDQNMTIGRDICSDCALGCVAEAPLKSQQIRDMMRTIQTYRTEQLSKARTIVTTSQYIANKLATLLPEARISAIGNPSGAAGIVDAFQENIKQATPPEILVVGMLNQNKGSDRAVEWILKLRQHLPDFRLVMAGAGQMGETLKRKAVAAGVADHLHLTGFLDRPSVFRAYRRASVVLAPNTWPEPFGRVPLEAGLSRRPVVAYDVGGVGESIVDGQTGFLVPPGKEDELIARVVECITKPGLADMLGEAAHTHILKRYNADKVASALSAIWAEHLTEASPNQP